MYILHLLILVSFYFFSASPSLTASDTQVSEDETEDEANSPSTDAAFDTHIIENGLVLPPSDAAYNAQVFENGPTLAPHDQPWDESTANPNPISSSGFTNFLDGDTVADADDTPTEFNTDSSQEIGAENLCPSPGSRPNGKIMARDQNSCSAPRQIDAGGIDGESDGEEIPDMSITKFNARPLGRYETMDDMCRRFMGGIMPNAVCSSGFSHDETFSVVLHPRIPFVVTKLENCHRVKPGIMTCDTDKSIMHCCMTYWMKKVATTFVEFAEGCLKLDFLRNYRPLNPEPPDAGSRNKGPPLI